MKIQGKFNTISFVKTYSLYFVLGALIIFFSIFAQGFLTWCNFINILKRTTITAILSLGTLFVIISGGIDISNGAIATLSSVIIATALLNGGITWPILILALVVLALLIGLFSGSAVALGNVPPIITTLALASMIRGGMMVYTGGFTIDAGRGVLIRFLNRASFLGIPNMIWVVLIMYFIGYVLLTKTKFGRYVYAIGGDSEICEHAGIPVKKVRILVFIFASMVAFVAGILLYARLGVGQPTALINIELDCIAAVVLGGASLSGGRGSIINTFLGVVTLGLLINGMNYLNVVTYWQYVVQGCVILFAALVHSQRK
ncbi:MAG: ABC transporter permease [Sphaerochaetaceae bacterium]